MHAESPLIRACRGRHACRAMVWAATGVQSTQQGLRQLPEASSPPICSVQWFSAGCRQPPQSQPARPFTSPLHRWADTWNLCLFSGAHLRAMPSVRRSARRCSTASEAPDSTLAEDRSRDVPSRALSRLAAVGGASGASFSSGRMPLATSCSSSGSPHVRACSWRGARVLIRCEHACPC